MNIDNELVKSLRERLIEIYEISHAELDSYEAAISAHAITSMQTEQPVKQYYWKDNNCPALFATDSNCICWHNKGTGIYAVEPSDVILNWRDKPANTAPATSMQGDSEPTDAQLITAAYQARIIDANHDWVGKLESDKLTHIRHFHNMLKAQIGWNDRVKGVSDANKDADTVGLIASREIMKILANNEAMPTAQLQAKIQCAVVDAIGSQLSTNTDGWVSVKSKLPDYDKSVFCYCRIYGRFLGYVDKFGTWHSWTEKGILPPIFWKPMPDEPSEDLINAISQDKGE